VRRQKTLKLNSSRRTAVFFGLILSCAGLGGFCLVEPIIDREICLSVAVWRIDVEPSYTAIYSYIRESIVPGMSRDKALEILEQIGSVSAPYSTKLPRENIISDQVYINTCGFWFNNIRLFLYYTADTQQVTDIVSVED
jgi:hypothetical protein